MPRATRSAGRWRFAPGRSMVFSLPDARAACAMSHRLAPSRRSNAQRERTPGHATQPRYEPVTNAACTIELRPPDNERAHGATECVAFEKQSVTVFNKATNQVLTTTACASPKRPPPPPPTLPVHNIPPARPPAARPRPSAPSARSIPTPEGIGRSGPFRGLPLLRSDAKQPSDTM